MRPTDGQIGYERSRGIQARRTSAHNPSLSPSPHEAQYDRHVAARVLGRVDEDLGRVSSVRGNVSSVGLPCPRGQGVRIAPADGQSPIHCGWRRRGVRHTAEFLTNRSTQVVPRRFRVGRAGKIGRVRLEKENSGTEEQGRYRR